MSNQVLGSLLIKVLGDIAEFRTSMQQTQDLARATSEKVGQQLATANRAILATVTGLISIAAVTGLKNTFDEIVAGAAALKDMSERTGISVERWSAMSAAAKAGGHDIATLESGILKLTKGLVGADEETKGAGAALAYLGIQSRDSFGKMRDGSLIIEDVARKFAKFPDGPGKSALAIDLMGKSGAQNLPLLKDLGEMTEWLGKVTTEQAEQADNYERSIRELTKAKDAWKKEIAFGVLPVAESFVKMLLELRKQNDAVGDSAKKLRSDGTVEAWARDSALAVAFLIDAARAIPIVFKAAGISIAGVAFDANAAAGVVGNLADAILFTHGGRHDLAAKAWSDAKGWFSRLGDGAKMAKEDVDGLYDVFTKGSFEEALKTQFDLQDAARAIGNVNDKTKEATGSLDGYRGATTKTTAAANDLGLALAKAWADFNLDSAKASTKRAQEEIQSLIDSLQRLNDNGGASESLLNRIGALTGEKFEAMAKGILAERKIVEDALDGIFAKIASASTDADRTRATVAYVSEAKKLIPIEERISALSIERAKNVENLANAVIRLRGEEGRAIATLHEGERAELATNEALKRSTEEMGLNARQLIDLNVSRLDAKIALTELAHTTEAMTDADKAYLENLKGMRAALADRRALQDTYDATAQINDLMKNVNDGMTSFFADFIQNGTSAFGTVWGKIKQFFAQVAAQFATKFVLNIAMNLLGGGGASGGGGLGGLLSSVLGGGTGGGFNLSSLFSGGGSLFGQLPFQFGAGPLAGGTGLAGLASSLGLNSLATGIASAGAGLVANIGTLGTAFSSGIAAAGGFASVLGAAIPIIGAIAALASVLGVFDNPTGIKIDNSITDGNNRQDIIASALGGFDVSGDLGNDVFQPLIKSVNQLDDYIANNLLGDETLATVKANLQAISSDVTDWFGYEDEAGAKVAIEKATKLFLQQRYGTVFDSIDKTIAESIRAFAGTSDELAGYLTAVVQIDWSALSQSLRGAVATLASTKDGVATALALIQSAKTIQSIAGTDFLQAGRDLFDAQSKTAMDAWREQGTALDELIDKANDGTIGFAELTKGAADFATAALKASADIASARASVAASITEAIRGYTLSGMTNEEQIKFLQAEVEQYRNKIGLSTDPKEIENLVQAIIKDSQAAFALLTPEQQTAARADYIAGLTALKRESDAAMERVEKNLQESTRSVFEDVQKGLDSIVASLDKSAKLTSDSTGEFGAAVDEFGRIIRTPITITDTRSPSEINGGQ